MNEPIPGPWEWDDGGNLSGPDDQVVMAIMRGIRPGEADASAIAAAPDMLAACEDLIGWLDAPAVTDRDTAIKAMLEKVGPIRAAIEKARGRAVAR